MDACPDENLLVALATRGLTGDRLARVEAHLDVCATCMEVVAHAASLLASESGDTDRRIDRYTVQEELGRGAMGIVYAAYDPALERRVALKVLRFGFGGPGDERRRRLLREARAMAHLSHENVVPVFDVGQIGSGTAFIAMELVGGMDLRRWLARPRSREEMWDVLVQAGRGLAAAHAAGVVHRDFKPANVLVDASGRARVTDFGLARVVFDEVLSSDGSIVSTGSATASLTADGTVVGTPAYMAPEQLRGESDDPSVDQWSYCVTLYEALVGRRPFAGHELDDLQDAIANGLSTRPSAAVSRRVWRVLQRGLSHDARDRWPSMEVLLDRLVAARARRTRSVVGGVALGLVVAAAVWTIADADEACSSDPAWLDDAWGPARRDAVEAALLGTDTPYAAHAWDYASTAIDDWAQRWIEMRVDACLAVHERREQTAETLDLRNLCLDRRRDELAALTESLTHADAAAVETLPDAVAGLTPLSVCADVEALRSVVPLPDAPNDRERVERARLALDRVARAWEAGQFAEGLAAVEPIVAEADVLRYEPLRAEARLQRGRLLYELGRLDEADRELADAALAGISGSDARSTATAASVRATVLTASGDFDGALESVKTGLAAADRIAHDPDLRGGLLTARGAVFRRQARFDEARGALVEVLELAEAELGPDHPRTAAALVNIANVDAQRGRTTEARKHYERAIAIQERVYGDAHPIVANTMGNLAIAASLAGDPDDAARLGTEAVRIAEASLGRDHADTLRLRSNLAVVYTQAGRYAEALAAHERILAARRLVRGNEHPEIAESLTNVGQALIELGRFEDADAILREAYDVGVRLNGSSHPSVLTTRYNQARVAIALGDAASAVRTLEDVIAVRQRVLGPEHTHVASSVFELARAQAALGQRDEAVETYERAATIFDAAGLPDDAARARAAGSSL